MNEFGMIGGLAFLMVSQILLELSLTLILITLDSIRLFDFGCWRWYELCSISMIVCLEAFEALPATSLLSASMGPVEAKG
ncbi:hypothetical protein EV421DRAFT_1986344 [Armillaria borealis]|nr:hypothetical protein EV421DRAFT_1986344 [Armillaria borealis]